MIESQFSNKIEKDFNSSKISEESKNRQQSKKKEIPKDPRYNEKIATVNFLKSSKGLPFLLQIGKSTNFGSENILKEIEQLIDFYSSWTSSFPVRKNLKVSK